MPILDCAMKTNMPSPRVQRTVLVVLCLHTVGGLGSLTAADSNTTPPLPEAYRAQMKWRRTEESLLLVRAWNPATGELIGWLPMHRLEITLKNVAGVNPDFKLNQAATLRWPDYLKEGFPHGTLKLATGAMTIKGYPWIPIERN
jgi:hypothetical protein